MNRSFLVAGLAGAAMLLAGCATNREPVSPDTPAAGGKADVLAATPTAADPDTRLADALALIYEDSPLQGQLSYTGTITDLDSDGAPDAVAYVAGPNGCEDGCDLFIFRGENQRFEAINRLPLARPPLDRLADARQGWAGLVTRTFDPGTGQAVVQRLVFDGNAYQLAGGTMDATTPVRLIDSMADTKTVPEPGA